MKLHAPQEHGQILALPALDQVGGLIQRNRHLLSTISLAPVGKSLLELRALARREVRTAALRYHEEAGEEVTAADSDTWILAGHQPELFHPGVWFKNFALHKLARNHQAISLNLVVDTDSAKAALLHVPAEGHLARVPYDRSSLETPYEERTVQEEQTFAEFPDRATALMAPWNFSSLLPTFWQDVMRQAQRTPLLGERFAAARRSMERRWGCVQFEVPMSRVCQTEAFAWFGCAILGRLLTFHDTYNQIVREYRREHGIRSRHHPVPDLAVDGEWLEAPFWAWRPGESRRGKLFLRRTRETWTLRVGAVEGPTLPATQPERAVEAWRRLETQGFKIRSRALTTTMFARLFLADLFIHGIGGGIYDELTDRIIERYFAMPAPAFLILSATLLLPLPRFPDAVANWRKRSHELRDSIYKPELSLALTDPPSAIHDLEIAKREWISRAGPTHEARVARFQRLRSLNQQLQRWVQPQIERLRTELAEDRRQIAWDEIASRRDYAFCLYPEEMLRTFFENVQV